CVEGMRLIRDSIERVFRDGSDAAARTNMSLASLLGGLALANAGLGVVHGFAAPLGGLLDAHHGEICAAILPHGVAANIRALAPGGRGKFDEAARIVTGKPGATAPDLVSWLNGIVDKLEIRSLGQLGLKPEQVPEAVAKAAQASSMKANPITLNSEQLTNIASAALEGAPATI
ncbi:MAG TPA: iron-containing alcohol dehydrogenase, partial [Rhizomicrobium sp.]|nr:iron-containing alcohol dehydrogenase [Rhizomicrobium sp.]